MCVLLEVSVPQTRFPPETVAERAATEIRFKPTVPLGDPHPLIAVPQDLKTDGRVDTPTVLDHDSSVAAWQVIGRSQDRILYRLRFEDGTVPFSRGIDAAGGEVLEAPTPVSDWELRLRFPEAPDVTTFRQECHDAGISIEIERFRPADTASRRDVHYGPT